MGLLTATRRPPTSADALASYIGCSTQDLVERFGFTEVDVLNRPLLRWEDAAVALAEFENAAGLRDRVRDDYMRWRDERTDRRKAVGEAAKAAVRDRYTLPKAGGQQAQAWMEAQWQAERAALAEFDKNEPELTITEFRERHMENQK